MPLPNILSAPPSGAMLERVMPWDSRERQLAPARHPVDLLSTTPTLFPDQLRAMARLAVRISADPLHALDNNPFIAREWVILGVELSACARRIEDRYRHLFTFDTVMPEIGGGAGHDYRERPWGDALRHCPMPVIAWVQTNRRLITMLTLACGLAAQLWLA